MARLTRVRRLILRAKWLPRGQKAEPVALTHFDEQHFDEMKRIEVDIGNSGFKVSPELFKFGEQYLAELALEQERCKARAAKISERAGQGKKQTWGIECPVEGLRRHYISPSFLVSAWRDARAAYLLRAQSSGLHDFD